MSIILIGFKIEDQVGKAQFMWSFLIIFSYFWSFAVINNFVVDMLWLTAFFLYFGILNIDCPNVNF